MSKSTHGNKRYLQILLDPNRAKFLDEIAAERGVRVTALVRDVLYEFLKKNVEKSRYELALAKDEAIWAQTVRNRVAGRTKKKSEPPQSEESKRRWQGLFGRFGNEHQS